MIAVAGHGVEEEPVAHHAALQPGLPLGDGVLARRARRRRQGLRYYY